MATRVGHLAGRRIIAVDGKTMRGARTTSGAPHLVAAFDHASGAVVGQLAVTSKSNEIPALRDLLHGMDITGAVISADAMHCQRETAKHITGRDAHYILTVKAPADPPRRVQGPALARRARRHHHRPRPRPASPPHHQGRAGPRLDRLPRRRTDHPTPPNPNHQGPQDNRGRAPDSQSVVWVDDEAGHRSEVAEWASHHGVSLISPDPVRGISPDDLRRITSGLSL